MYIHIYVYINLYIYIPCRHQLQLHPDRLRSCQARQVNLIYLYIYIYTDSYMYIYLYLSIYVFLYHAIYFDIIPGGPPRGRLRPYQAQRRAAAARSCCPQRAKSLTPPPPWRVASGRSAASFSSWRARAVCRSIWHSPVKRGVYLRVCMYLLREPWSEGTSINMNE